MQANSIMDMVAWMGGKMPYTKTIVDVRELNLSEKDYDTIADFYEISNDSYYRYYPHNTWTYIPQEIKNRINEKLISLGVVFEDDTYFSILLRFDW